MSGDINWDKKIIENLTNQNNVDRKAQPVGCRVRAGSLNTE